MPLQHFYHSPGASALAHLRGLMPRRLLTLAEALQVAEHQAGRLLALQGIEDAPVPDEVLTSLPRLTVHTDPSLPEAMLGSSDWDRFRRTWTIALSTRVSHEQRRVTMLHEYKHILDYGSAGLAVRRRSDVAGLGIAPDEYVADFFAVCTLMPRRALKAAWCAGQQDVVALAAAFGVPVEAMVVRLGQLGLTDGTKAALGLALGDLPAIDHGRYFSSRTAWSCPHNGGTEVTA